MKKTVFIKFTAVALLLLVAVIHFIILAVMPVSPWKGGGFGMFSTVGSHKMFLVRAYYNGHEKSIPIRIPAELNNYRNDIYFFPARSRLFTLKQKLENRKWWVSGDTVITGKAQKATDAALELRASDITVELWQVMFNAKSSIVSTSLRLKN
jgi:hypothetical protein